MGLKTLCGVYVSGLITGVFYKEILDFLIAFAQIIWAILLVGLSLLLV